MRKSFLKELSHSLRQGIVEKDLYVSRVLAEIATPIQPRKNLKIQWEVLESPRRLVRTYNFPDTKKLQEFINEILEYQNKTNHAANIKIDHNDVLIEVYTRDLNCLTELDYEYAKMADLIYQDMEYYR